MLNRKDLVLIKYDEGISKLFNKIHKEVLKRITLEWFKVPEIRPSDSTAKLEYEDITKAALVQRITNYDWPQGLYAYQVAQLKRQDLAFSSFIKSVKLMTLHNKDRNIKLNLTLEEIQQSIEKCLSTFFHTYVYAEHNKETDTFVFIISIQDLTTTIGEPQQDPTTVMFEDLSYAVLIYYPETKYAVTTKKFWNAKDKEVYMHDALCTTFSATEIGVEEIPFTGFDKLRQSIQSKSKSSGIIQQLHQEEINSNPLNIKQKRPKGFNQTYMKTREQRKRIVPINMEKMKLQYEAIDENFGWGEVQGHKTLDVNLELPFDTGRENDIAETEYQDDIVEISIKIEGINVARGIRDLINNGVIETPAASWLQNVAISRAKKITVKQEGIFQQEEDDSNKRPRISSSQDGPN